MKFLSQSGVSLIQGLVIASALAGSALVATRLVLDQKKMMKGVETRDQIEQLHRLVFSVLQNRENCQGTFLHAGGANITSAVLGQTNPISTIRSKTNSAGSWVTNYEVNPGSTLDLTKTYMNGNVTIQSMQLRFPSATDPARENVMTYPAKLRIEYARLEGADLNKRTKTGYGAKRIIKEIAVLMQVDTPAAGIYPITACYAVQLGSSNNGQTLEGNNNLNQEFCSNLGTGGSLYTWDSLKNKCVLKNNICPAKYIFVGIKPDGNAECKPMSFFLPYMVNTTDTTPCDTTSGATVSLTTDAFGKIQIACTPAAPSICAAGSVNWTQGADTCTSAIAAGAGPTAVTDSTAPTTGSGTATCSAGTWSATGTCSVSTCPAGSVNWTQGADTCTSAIAAGAGPTAVTDFTTPTTGNATATCSSGTWSASGTCTSMCMATAVSWWDTSTGLWCDSPVTPGWGPVAVTDSVGPATGTATATCSFGNWDGSGGTCTAPGACPSGNINWTVGANTCTQFVNGNLDGYGPVMITDWTSPGVGDATITCNSGTWVTSGTTCAP